MKALKPIFLSLFLLCMIPLVPHTVSAAETGFTLDKTEVVTKFSSGKTVKITPMLNGKPMTAEERKAVAWTDGGGNDMKNGTVKIVSPGEDLITANFNGTKQTCLIRALHMEADEIHPYDENTSQMVFCGSRLKNSYGMYFTANPEVEWKSSNPDIISVEQYGKMTAHKWGTVTISATYQGITCKAKVKSYIPDIALNKHDMTLYTANKTASLKAKVHAPKGSTVAWSSSDPSIITVNKGKLKRVGYGTATITVTLDDPDCAEELVDTCQITALETKTNLWESDVNLGESEEYTLEPEIIGKSQKVTYKSSNKKVVKVDKKGNLIGLQKGTAKITATANKAKDTVLVTVGDKADHIHVFVTNEKGNYYCGETVTKEYACSSCGFVRASGSHIVDHEYQLVSETEATCTEDGYLLHECRICHNQDKYVTEKARGHKVFDDLTSEEMSAFLNWQMSLTDEERAAIYEGDSRWETQEFVTRNGLDYVINTIHDRERCVKCHALLDETTKSYEVQLFDLNASNLSQIINKDKFRKLRKKLIQEYWQEYNMPVPEESKASYDNYWLSLYMNTHTDRGTYYGTQLKDRDFPSDIFPMSYSIRSIADYTFQNDKDIAVIQEDGHPVKYRGDDSMDGDGLYYDLTYIGKSAFEGSGLKTGVGNWNAEVVGDRAFYGCEQAESVRITVQDNQQTGVGAYSNLKDGADIWIRYTTNSTKLDPVNTYKDIFDYNAESTGKTYKLDIYFGTDEREDDFIASKTLQNCIGLTEFDTKSYIRPEDEVFKGCINLKKLTMGSVEYTGEDLVKWIYPETIVPEPPTIYHARDPELQVDYEYSSDAPDQRTYYRFENNEKIIMAYEEAVAWSESQKISPIEIFPDPEIGLISEYHRDTHEMFYYYVNFETGEKIYVDKDEYLAEHNLLGVTGQDPVDIISGAGIEYQEQLSP